MLYTIGTKVKLIHTGHSGIVTAHLDNGMVTVRLPDGDEIPASPDDLAHVDDFFSNQKFAKAKSYREKEKVYAPAQAPTPATPHKPVTVSLGIQLAFEPMHAADGTTTKYLLYLINDTRYDVLYNLELTYAQSRPLRSDGILKSMSTLQLGEMLFDQLNDSPQVFMEMWQITTAGQGDPIHRTQKIKAQQFFTKVAIAPLLNRPAHVYHLLESFDAEPPAPAEDLQTYTRRLAPPPKYRTDENLTEYEVNSPREYAGFLPEIDLHIEKLSADPSKLNAAETLRLQLRHFDAFVEKAIRLGVPRVFIIHGIGKGRLRDEIATRLLKLPEVKTFRNEFHPRYGWGATEVEF
jgi:hypothetical protein